MATRQHPPRRKRVKGHPGVYYRIRTNGKRTYEVTYLDSTGQRRWSMVDGDLEAADKALRAIKTKLDQRQKVVPSNRRFEELAWDWFEGEKDRLRPNTQRNYESGLRLHVLPKLGKLKPAEVTEERIVDLIRSMERDGKAESTIKNALAPLSRVLNWLSRRGMVNGNALSRLEKSERPKSSPKSEKRVLTRDEIRALLDGATSARYRMILSLAVNTGMRQSEILGLRWSDIDFDEGTIRVNGQLERGRTESGVWIAPEWVAYAKSKKGHRTVSLIDSSMFTSLKSYYLACGRPEQDQLVFRTTEGTPMSHRNVSNRGFDRAKKNGGIDVPGKPKLKLHHLRDTYASATIAAGVDAYYLSRQLGHEDAAFTQRTYVDFFEARDKSVQARNLLAASGFTGLT